MYTAASLANAARCLERVQSGVPPLRELWMPLAGRPRACSSTTDEQERTNEAFEYLNMFNDHEGSRQWCTTPLMNRISRHLRAEVMWIHSRQEVTAAAPFRPLEAETRRNLKLSGIPGTTHHGPPAAAEAAPIAHARRNDCCGCCCILAVFLGGFGRNVTSVRKGAPCPKKGAGSTVR